MSGIFNKPPQYKLTSAQIDDARLRYEEEGWKITWIALILNVHRSTVIHHARYNGWVRKIRVLKKLPEQIADLYRERRKNRYSERNRGTYEFIRFSNDMEKQKHCQHIRWVKRCSICGNILGSDATEHNHH